MRRQDNLAQKLFFEPFLFEFSQAVHLLCALGQIDSDALNRGDFLAFKSSLLLSPPASDLLALMPQEAPHLQNLGAKKLFKGGYKKGLALNAYVNFFGIAGAQGPLPTVYTEDILRRLKVRDASLADFFDIFNHRFMTLFYRLQQRRLPTLLRDTPDKSLLGNTLLSLSGVRKKKDSALQLRSFLPVAQILWKRPHTPQGLSQLLKHHFGLSNIVSSFRGRVFKIPMHRRTRVGHTHCRNNALAHSFVLGKRAYTVVQGIQIDLEIHNRKQFLGFLPKGEYYESLLRVVRSYIGTRLSFELILSLKEAPVFRLASKTFPLRLGWTTWLGGRAEITSKQRVSVSTVQS